MADEVMVLAVRFSNHEEVQPQLSVKTQTWYHGARGFMEKTYPDKIEWLEHCFEGDHGMIGFINMVYPWPLSDLKRSHADFLQSFATARGLVHGSLERAKSLEYDTVIVLSAALVADQYETALQLFANANGDESLLRAAGTLGRVALERHLYNVADSKQIQIRVNPPPRKNLTFKMSSTV